jgi:hypothetical protein
MLYRTRLAAWWHTQGEKKLSHRGRERRKLTAQSVKLSYFLHLNDPPNFIITECQGWIMQYNTVLYNAPTSITPGQYELWIMQNHLLILNTTLQVSCLTSIWRFLLPSPTCFKSYHYAYQSKFIQNAIQIITVVYNFSATQLLSILSEIHVHQTGDLL